MSVFEYRDIHVSVVCIERKSSTSLMTHARGGVRMRFWHTCWHSTVRRRAENHLIFIYFQ